MSPPSGALHFQRADGKTVCGREIRGMIRVTGNPYQVTCRMCLHSPYMDEWLANYNERGIQ